MDVTSGSSHDQNQTSIQGGPSTITGDQIILITSNYLMLFSDLEYITSDLNQTKIVNIKTSYIYIYMYIYIYNSTYTIYVNSQYFWLPLTKKLR